MWFPPSYFRCAEFGVIPRQRQYGGYSPPVRHVGPANAATLRKAIYSGGKLLTLQ
jgi:hypothetical protein